MFGRVATLTSTMVVLSIIGAVIFAMPARHYGPKPSSALAHSFTFDPRGQSRIVEVYGKLPMSFEANRGQTASDVKFLSRGSGYSLFLTSTEAVLSIGKQPPNQIRAGKSSEIGGEVLRMKLVGANPDPEVTGQEELPGKSNYFIGNDPSRWQTNISTYAKVRYKNVYSGIDMIYYGNRQQLEYDFVVAPGADPRNIRLAFPSRDEPGSPAHSDALGWREGAVPIKIDDQGDLVLTAIGSQLRLHRPVVYQEVDGSRQSVAGNFVIEDAGQVGFEVARYDMTRPLIIDPTLVYSTYLGGSSADEGIAIAVDSSGSAYVTGWTTSTNFPTTGSAFQAAKQGAATSSDVFVTKLNAAGSALVYSTYLGGGTSGSGTSTYASNDNGSGIAVDSSGNAYVTGTTQSTNFPTTAGAFQIANAGGTGCYTAASPTFCADAFVTKLNPTGSALVYSTYLGGVDYDYGYAIAVDSSGNAYVTGSTFSTNFPTLSPFQSAHASDSTRRDAFVTKLNAAGSGLSYSTYLGGNNSDGGTGIAVDASGNAYVTGYTFSTNLLVSSNAYQKVNGGGTSCTGVACADAFVAKFNTNGTGSYFTYLGGSAADGATAIAVDSSGNTYVTGYTSSSNFPTSASAFQKTYGGSQDAFVTKLNSAGSALLYSTYLGGSGNDQGNGIAVDSSGNAYVTGFTLSTNFPTLIPFQAANGGNFDAFVAKLNPALSGSASLIYSTYLGGSGNDYGYGIAVDSSGHAYVTGATPSTNFPTLNPYQPANGGNYDVFVTKIAP